MKKIIMLLTAVMIVVGFSGSASAFLDDNSTNADATANAVSAINQPINVNVNMPAQKDLTTVNTNAKGYRGFAVPGDIPIPAQGPAYFGNTTPGPQFQSMKTVLIYKNTFTVNELTIMAKGCDVDVMPNPLISKPAKDATLASDVKIFLSKPATATLVGFITVKSGDDDDVSVDVMAKAALEAQKMGGNAIHITAEGVKRQLKSFGWGIGLSNSTATMSSSEQTGTITSGGFGISGGHAGYVDFPWLQIFVLQVN